MKTITTILMCALCIFTGLTQTDSDSERSGTTSPERTPELEALYQQAKTLENNGNASEINANRLAIKNAWQEVNPAMAELYKPTETNNASLPLIFEGSYEVTRSPEDWDLDGLLRTGFIDGLDMNVTGDGDIYVTGFESFAGSGGSDTDLFVYRSTDNGISFELWTSLGFSDTRFDKIQTIAMDGNGEEYLLIYLLDDNNLFFTLRLNMTTKVLEGDIVSTDVTDFSVDSNYITNTSSRRVFATYAKPNTVGELTIHAARSTAGSYGFDWVDEVNITYYTSSVAFAYGHNGACYAALISSNSGNLYAMVNPDNGDPATWDGLIPEVVATGSVTETKDPTISAARNASVNEDNVLILASSRAAGSTDHFDSKVYRRTDGAAFAPTPYITTNSEHNIVHIDSWIRRVNNVETIQTSFVLEKIDGSENNLNFSLTYDGTDFDWTGIVADIDIDVFQGFHSAVAETRDGLPCMAFAGTNTAVNSGFNLYFDRKSTLAVQENSVEGFTFYPNPANDVINLSAKNSIENVSIYSLLGQEVMKLFPEQNNSTIDITSLATGIYVMKVEMDGQIGSYKIIKE